MPPPTSPVFMIPDVFVIPPDEESHSAPYCCFDAAASSHEILSSPADTVSIHTVLHMLEQSTNPSPVFHRNTIQQEDLVMPRKGHRKPATREPENDSDVVEVIKVRKRVDSPTPSQVSTSTADIRRQLKTSTLKSRASKAFMSLKGIGKSSNTSKTHAGHIFPSPADEPTAVSRSASKRLRRPKSMQLGDATTSTSTTLGRRASQLARRSSISLSTLFHAPKEPSADQNPTSYQQAEESFAQLPLPDETLGPVLGAPLTRCRSPLPPSDSAESPPPNAAGRKFSVIGLQRFFSFSSITTSSKSEPQQIRPPTPKSRTSRSLVESDPETRKSDCILPPELSSSPPSSFPQIDSLVFSNSGLDMTPICSNSSSPAPSDIEDDGGPITPTDERPQPPFSDTGSRSSLARDTKSNEVDSSFEMRLDSLHFDSLSFDLDAF